LRAHEDDVVSDVFSPDGQTILTASDDGTTRLWPHYMVEYMVQEAYWRVKRGFTELECRQFFRDNLTGCPAQQKTIFCALVEYLSPAQRQEWEGLD
jgi:hypothetical protein